MTLPEGWTIKVVDQVDGIYVFDIVVENGQISTTYSGITRESLYCPNYILANTMRKLGIRINKKMNEIETRQLWNDLIVPLLTDALNNQ